MPHILAETPELTVAVKPPGLISEQTPDGTGFADLLATRNGGYIGTVHRLDRGVGGVMLYARTPEAAARLSRAAQEHQLGKEYLAVLEGVPQSPTGELRDLLYYDRARGKAFAVGRQRKGVKEAVLLYRVIRTRPHPETGRPLSLVSVRPLTGRTHQIRVQFASRRLPLLGDRRYGGSGDTGISLWCRSITLPAHNGAPQRTYALDPTGAPWDWLR